MSTKKRNAFEDFESMVASGEEVKIPISMDVGANNFFEATFPNTSPTEENDNKDNTSLEIPNINANDRGEKPEPKTQKQESKEDDYQEEDEELKTIEVNDSKNEADLDEYSEFSLIALAQIREGKWDLDEKEIPKDLDGVTLMELFDAQTTNSVEKIKEDLYNQAGEYANYLKYLLEGGSPQVVSDALDIKKVTLLDTSTEENQREILTALFEIKGLEEDVIEDTLETIFDKGKGKARAEEAIKQLQEYEKNILENQAKELENQRKQQEKQYQDYVSSVTKVVKTGKLGGIDISKDKQEQILTALFKPTEVIEVENPQTGKKEKRRATKSSILFKEANSSPEKTAAMVLWLLEGGNFEGLKEEVQEKKDNNIRKILEARKSTVVVNNQKNSKNSNNAFEVYANEANRRRTY